MDQKSCHYLGGRHWCLTPLTSRRCADAEVDAGYADSKLVRIAAVFRSRSLRRTVLGLDVLLNRWESKELWALEAAQVPGVSERQFPRSFRSALENGI
jgi:hypothetical protein